MPNILGYLAWFLCKAWLILAELRNMETLCVPILRFPYFKICKAITYFVDHD